jgi:hypothetical protein
MKIPVFLPVTREFGAQRRVRSRLSPPAKSQERTCLVVHICTDGELPFCRSEEFVLLPSDDGFPIQATPRRPGVEEIRIPSQRAFGERERRRAEGILIDGAVIAALEVL